MTTEKQYPTDRMKIEVDKGLIVKSRELFDKAIETMIAKNIDYSGKATDMKNFRVSAEVANVKMTQGILTRLMDKMTRIGNLLNKEEAAVKSESIFDTLQDAINYTAILAYGILIEDYERGVRLNNQNEELSDI